jgi:hypothetical protein
MSFADLAVLGVNLEIENELDHAACILATQAEPVILQSFTFIPAM